MNRTRSISLIVAALLIVGSVVGCTSEPLQPAAAPNPARASVNLPPKQALDEVKRLVSSPPMNLGVTEESDGVITTGWQRHKGNFHIGRHWQERTRYRIAVIPDWNEPTGKARLEVSAQTEERAAEGQTWTAAPQVHRPERAQALLDKLVAGLGGAGSSAQPR